MKNRHFKTEEGDNRSVDGSFQRSKQFIGDFLLSFAPRYKPSLGRMSTKWKTLRKGKNWKFDVQDPSLKWKGTPWTAFSFKNWEVYLVGEIFGTSCSSKAVKNIIISVVNGSTGADLLNGHFILLAWDRANRKWHIWTDRFGTLHAYFGKDTDRISAIGSFYPTVAQATANKEIDLIALWGFFSFGFFFSDQTFFYNVKILKPAMHYVYDKEGKLIRNERYWKWFYKPDQKRSYQDTIVEFGEIFGTVMTDLTEKGRIAIPISGGLDSRSTVAAITKPNGPDLSDSKLWSYSYGYTDDSVETCIARQIAKTRLLPFRSFTIQPYLFDQLDLVTRSMEGFQDVTLCRQANVVDNLKKHADYIIAAHWGDVWLDDMGLVPGVRNRVQSKVHFNTDLDKFVLQKMEKRGRDWLLEKICSPQAKKEETQHILHSVVAKELAKYEHIEESDFLLKAFKTDHWSFRWTTASLRMFQLAAYPRLPFYDNRIADFFCTVPSEFVADRKLQVDYLKQYAPDLAKIKWQVYDSNLYNYQYFNTFLVPKRAWKKLYRTLKRNIILQRNWEVQFMNQKGKEALEHHLLTYGIILHDYFSPNDIKSLLSRFFSKPDAENGYTVSMLLSFAAWLDTFMQ